jgi:hypothetical protein
MGGVDMLLYSKKVRYMIKLIRRVECLFVIIFLFTLMPLAASPTVQTKGNILQNISVFHEYGAYRNDGVKAPVNCSTWGSFEMENGSLPLERTVTNGRKKVYRVNGNGGIMFPIHGWASFSLEQYYENGVIEFDILGAVGGENFSVCLRSDTRGVTRTHSVTLSSQNIQVTRSWQNVKIPIKNIVGNTDDGFSIRDILLIILEIPGAHKFYLSEMYITSPDEEKQYPVIKVNQVGYELNQGKYALVSCFPGTLRLTTGTEFNVINTAGEIKFTGRLQQVSRNAEAVSGEVVYKADFSRLNEQGTYFIRITNPLINDSFKFTIGSNIYNNLLIDASKYFYIQRQGIDLDRRYAGVFARRNLHPGDRAVKRYSQRNVSNAPVSNLSQGWYDAGDFGKYFPPAATAVTDLLFAYEMFPSLFRDNHLNIPESGNGAPDILDEIKWELEMMLMMEDGSTGSFYEVANYEGDTIYLIDTNGVNGAGNTKSTAATAWAAGIFAHAYIVFKDIPLYSSFANRCIEAAKRAWTYLENNPNEYMWVSGAGRSYYYSQAEVAQIKFLAAAALFRAVGEEKFQRYVLENYRGFNYERELNTYHVATTGVIGTGFIHYMMTPNPNQAVVRFFEDKFRGYETQMLRNFDQNAWPTALPNWAYFWGSSKPIIRIPVELYMCNKVLKRDTARSVELLRNSVNYLLGINPLSFSFISGYGENSVKNIFSAIFTNDGINEIPRGFLAGGANQYESGFMSKYISKCYVDSDHEWTTNEHAIYWNAALVLGITVLAGASN